MARSAPAKARAKYRDYSVVIKGKLYAVVNVPAGKGKYKQKRKRVENKTEAQQWALSQLGKHHAGEDLFLASKRSFADFAEWYKEEFLVAPIYKDGKRIDGIRTWQRQRVHADRLVREFGGYDLKKITIDVLRRYKRARLRTGVSITAVNRDFALMRAMLNKAARRKWIDESPFDYREENLIEIALESVRSATLDDRIAKRLLARSRKSEQPLLHYLILLLMHTGARPSEAYLYQAGKDDEVPREPVSWDRILEFDFQAVRLVMYKGKVRKERIVPTSIELERGLRRLYSETKPKPEDLLFPLTTFARSWRTLCKSARVKGIVIRDFRRYFNSALLKREDLNDMERMLLLGHVEMKTNARYSHLDATFVRKFRQGVVQPIVIETEAVQ